MTAFYGVFGHKEIPQNNFADIVKEMKSKMKVLNDHLNGKYYLVGDNVTIADIMLAVYLIVPFQTVFDGGYRKAIPHLTEWFERVTSLPSVVKYCGYVKMTDKPFKAFDPKAKVEPIK